MIKLQFKLLYNSSFYKWDIIQTDDDLRPCNAVLIYLVLPVCFGFLLAFHFGHSGKQLLNPTSNDAVKIMPLMCH